MLIKATRQDEVAKGKEGQQREEILESKIIKDWKAEAKVGVWMLVQDQGLPNPTETPVQ